MNSLPKDVVSSVLEYCTPGVSFDLDIDSTAERNYANKVWLKFEYKINDVVLFKITIRYPFWDYKKSCNHRSDNKTCSREACRDYYSFEPVIECIETNTYGWFEMSDWEHSENCYFECEDNQVIFHLFDSDNKIFLPGKLCIPAFRKADQIYHQKLLACQKRK